MEIINIEKSSISTDMVIFMMLSLQQVYGSEVNVLSLLTFDLYI